MRGTLLLLVIVVGCGKTSINGEPDAQDSLDDQDGADASCGDCDDRDPCTVDTCNPLTAECEHIPLDADDDGYVAIESPDGTECGGDDCDDSNPDVYPGAPEVCLDGVDQDCDGMVDERLNPYGEVRITEAEGDSILPDIVWNGSEFGIVWRDIGLGACNIIFAILDVEGAKVGEDVYIYSRACINMERGLSVDWTGSEFGIVWDVQEEGSEVRTYFARIDSFGNEVEEEEWLSTSSSPIIGFPSIVWTGSEYGLIYAYGDVFFNRLSPEGIIVGDTVVIETDSSAGHPSIAWTGSLFGVVWTEWDTEFAVLDPLGSRLMDRWPGDYAPYHQYPDIISGGYGFGVVADIGGRIKFWSTDSTGSEIGSFYSMEGPRDHSTVRPSLCWTGSEFGMVWGDNRDYGLESTEDDEIYMSLIDISGDSIGDEHRISFHDGRSEEPVVEWTGSELGVAWQDDRDGNYEIYFSRVAICP